MTKVEGFHTRNKSGSYAKLKKLYAYSIETLTKKAQAIPCAGGDEFISIGYDGNIYACEMLNRPLVNIRDIDYDINNLLRIPEWNEAVKDIKQKRCYCTHFCWLEYSLARGKISPV